MTSALLPRAFDITFNSLAKKGLAFAFADATLSSLPTSAQAGLLGLFAGKVAEHVAERQVQLQTEGHFKSQALA